MVHEIKAHPVRMTNESAWTQYRGTCTCGWQGQIKPSELHALRDGDDHIVAIR